MQADLSNDPNTANIDYEIYEFASFRIDAHAREVYEESRQLSITGRAFDILLHMVKTAGQVVTIDELLSQVWPGLTVERGNVAVHVARLRTQLGPFGRDAIATVPRRGYLFKARVRLVSMRITGGTEIAMPADSVGDAAAKPDHGVIPNAFSAQDADSSPDSMAEREAMLELLKLQPQAENASNGEPAIEEPTRKMWRQQFLKERIKRLENENKHLKILLAESLVDASRLRQMLLKPG